ncbi:HEAT repeat domain-containing protein [Janibacter sp. GS2]|uniref:HEAT repeat domain-containing protein n=1 Tax=Janibacter sp. GS2 TaxID=3442646 RepID=UPI003EC0400E
MNSSTGSARSSGAADAVQIVVQPWILRLSLWVVLATFLVLLATIVMARVVRRQRSRVLDRDLVPVRSDVLAIASGDDDEEADGRLRRLRGRAAELVEPLLVGYLSKVRGAPAQRIVDILMAHGLVARARRGLTSWSGTRRARSAWVLGVMRIGDAASEVVPLLQDRDRGVSVTAARSLGMLRDDSSADALLAAVAPGRRGRGELPVWVVVEALGGLGADAAEAIGRALQSEDASTRAVAAMTIGRGQHLSQRSRLLDVVAHEEDPTVLAAIARSLGEIGDPSVVPTLTGLTDRAHSRSVRLSAISALGEIGGPAATEVLTALLADGDTGVEELTAEALSGLGRPGVDVLQTAARAGLAGAAAAEYALVMHSLREPMPGGA